MLRGDLSFPRLLEDLEEEEAESHLEHDVWRSLFRNEENEE